MADSELTSPSYLYKNYAIIVAGGSGTRMGATTPKQFLLLKGKPVMMHTIDAFSRSNAQPEIIVVLPADFHDHWKQLCVEHNFTIPHSLVSGGQTRFHSVANGLAVIDGDGHALVAVHDAVRPATGTAIIDNAYQYAAEHGNAVAAVKSRDSVRQVKNTFSVTLPRDEVYLVQTPQTFQLQQLKTAYSQAGHQNFTDDASVVEAAGFTIHLVEGSYSNIKITFREDIAIAELLMG
jgi:2-C-methyl-D-erythritol 4-phosphate cytidylyltransferase